MNPELKIWNRIWELIDTYWNVKDHKEADGQIVKIELIDTYWNVKTALENLVPIAATGINRYILECKD